MNAPLADNDTQWPIHIDFFKTFLQRNSGPQIEVRFFIGIV